MSLPHILPVPLFFSTPRAFKELLPVAALPLSRHEKRDQEGAGWHYQLGLELPSPDPHIIFFRKPRTVWHAPGRSEAVTGRGGATQGGSRGACGKCIPISASDD